MFNNDYLILEFGNFNIKLMEAHIDKKEIKIHRMDLIPTIENSIKDGEIVDAEKVVSQLSNYIISNNIKAKKTILTITSQSIMMRQVVVQSYKKNVIKSFIELEADNYFPVDLSTCMVDYKILPPGLDNPDDEECRVMIVAIPFEILDKYISVANLLGLQLISIDVASDSIVKLYSKRKHSPSENESDDELNSTAFIDIGAEITNITIATNNVIKYNKILNFGASNLNHAISHGNTLTKEEVEYIKKDYDISVPYLQSDAQGREKDIRAMIVEFMENLSAFFDFHNSRKTGNRINNIILVGGGAYQKGIKKLFEEVFSMPVITEFDFDGVHFDHKIKNIEQKILYFYKCIGACIKE